MVDIMLKGLHGLPHQVGTVDQPHFTHEKKKVQTDEKDLET